MASWNGPALLVDDLDAARRFYVRALGCRLVGTEATRLALELHGQPLTLLAPSDADAAGETLGEAANEASFVLGVDDWCTTSERLREHAVDVDVEPGRRFGVEPGTQCAMRLADPDGNPIALLGFAAEPDRLAA